jgi:dTDP-glucose 4,6-dehydratase
MTMAYHRQHKIDTKIVRIFNTYGPRMRINDGRVVPAFISQALQNKPITVFGEGTQTRSFCYCSDLIEGIYRLMMSNTNQPCFSSPKKSSRRQNRKAKLCTNRCRRMTRSNANPTSHGRKKF